MNCQSFDNASIIYHILRINTCTVLVVQGMLKALHVNGYWLYLFWDHELSLGDCSYCMCFFPEYSTTSEHTLTILVPVCLNACRITGPRLVDWLVCGRKTQVPGLQEIAPSLCGFPTLQPGDLLCLLPLLYSGEEPSLEKAEHAESEIMMNRYWRRGRICHQIWG